MRVHTHINVSLAVRNRRFLVYRGIFLLADLFDVVTTERNGIIAVHADLSTTVVRVVSSRLRRASFYERSV